MGAEKERNKMKANETVIKGIMETLEQRIREKQKLFEEENY